MATPVKGDMSRQGSIADMMLAAGFTVDQVERTVNALTVKLAPEMGAIIGASRTEAWREVEMAKVNRARLMAS